MFRYPEVLIHLPVLPLLGQLLGLIHLPVNLAECLVGLMFQVVESLPLGEHENLGIATAVIEPHEKNQRFEDAELLVDQEAEELLPLCLNDEDLPFMAQEFNNRK